MQSAKKKEREEFWLNRLRAEIDPKFEIDDQRNLKEQPDFLIRYQDRIVGVEIAELQLDHDKRPSKGSALQEKFNLQQKVVLCAQKLYFGTNSRPINIQVFFQPRPSQTIQSVNRHNLAQLIANSLHQITLEPFEQRRLDWHSDPPVPPPVSFIYARGLPSEIKPRWQVIAPGHSRELQSRDVQSLLAAKNALISQYRKTASENWLLIVADGRNPSGMFRAPGQKIDLPASEFNRTFLLCEPERFFIEWPQSS